MVTGWYAKAETGLAIIPKREVTAESLSAAARSSDATSPGFFTMVFLTAPDSSRKRTSMPSAAPSATTLVVSPSVSRPSARLLTGAKSAVGASGMIRAG